MSPNDYIQARSNDTTEDNGDKVVMVDDRPYLTNVGVDVDSFESTVKNVVLQMFDITKDKQDLLSVSIVSGGITNNLYHVTGLSSCCGSDSSSILKDADSVLVRVFGAEGMIDRDVENSTYAALASCTTGGDDAVTIAPKYYGRFQNGRIEEWLGDSMRPLQTTELAQAAISKGMAEEMAQLHACFQVPEHLHAHHNPTNPCLWNQLQSWLTQATDACQHEMFLQHGDYLRALVLYNNFIKESIPQELKLLQTTVAKDSSFAIAFCHNDLLAANVLYNDTTQKIRLIDFEYGGMNYTSFDIANHFNEYAGGTDDGQTNYDWFPSKEHQIEFITTYLQTKTKADTVTPKLIEETLNQVKLFVLVNHLYWGLWAMNQAATEGCQDFDYLLYCKNRLERYFVYKQQEEIELVAE